jgi:hypothetical protein
MIQGTETAIYENETSVQETANTVTGEHSEDTPGEEVTILFQTQPESQTM